MSTTVREVEARDIDAVRDLWASGLIYNTVNAELAYPTSLVEEETKFVNETLQYGDMSSSEALINAYQCNTEHRTRTNFWVAVTDNCTSCPGTSTVNEGDTGNEDETSCMHHVVGCVGLRQGKFPVGDIGRFGVSLSYRGLGVGAQLLGVLEEYAKQQGYISVTATTVALNIPAIHSYQKAGYREVYRGRQDGKQNEPDFIRMQKDFT